MLKYIKTVIFDVSNTTEFLQFYSCNIMQQLRSSYN